MVCQPHIKRCHDRAMSRRKGPVHINVRLAEPLGLKREAIGTSPRVIEMISSDGIVNKEIVRELGRRVAGSKVMFVAGFLPLTHVCISR